MIKITPTAWKRLSNIKNTFAFLFSATGGGCGGFNYNLKHISFDEYKKIHDAHKKIYSIQNKGVKFIVDPLSEMLLIGTTIDYISDDFDSKFIFIPQKDFASTCGCGTSFSPKPFKP